MRLWVIGFCAPLLAVALAGCGSADGPSSGTRSEGETDAEASPIDPGLVTLNPEGMTVGSEAFFFAAGQNEVEAALSRALGKPGDSYDLPECGAGPLMSSTYAESLTVNYQDGALVGWFLTGERDKIELSNELEIGTERAAVEAMEGFAMVEDSSLGEEFMIDDKFAGFFEEGKVSMLYAGTQCFFR